MQEEVPMRLLKIKTLSETTYELRVPASMSIKDLRIKVQEVSGVPAERQRMICMGQQLLDAKTVGDYAKDPEQPNWIHLVAKVQTQTAPEQTQPQAPQQQQQNAQQANNNRRPMDMFGGNVQIQTGSVGDLTQLLGNITNLFNPNRQQQPPQQQQQGAPQQPQQPTQSLFQFQFPPTNNVQQNNQATASTTTNTTSSVSQAPQAAQNTRSNLVSNQQPITIQRQIQLPHQELLNLGLACNNLMGPQSTFPGPPLPVLPSRGPAALIGSYLSNWQFQVQRTLPFVHRLAELLQRETYMTSPDDRSSTQALSLEVGLALNELVSCTQPLVGILSDIRLNQAPGLVRFEQNPNAPAPTLTRPPVQHPMQQNQATQNVQTSTTSTTQNNQRQNTSTTNQTQQQQTTVHQTTTTLPNVTASFNTNPLVSGLQSQPINIPPTSLPTQNNGQQVPQQATINITSTIAQGGDNNNVLNNLISQISGGQNGEVRIGVMNSTDNNQEIQIVGIGSTQIVNGDSNMDLSQVLGNILGQTQNLNLNSFNTGANNRNNAQTNSNNAQQNNANQHVDEEWEDDEEEDGNSIGIEMSSTINVNGNNPLLNNLLSSLGIPQNGSTGLQTTTISGSQAANLISQLTRPPQQQNVSQTTSTTTSVQQPQQQPNASSSVGQNQSTSFSATSAQQVPQQPSQEQPAFQQMPMQVNLQSLLGGGGNGGFNPLSMLMGGMGGGGLGNMMNMTVNELIRENQSALEEETQSEADQLVQDIIGQLRISDLVSSFISGQFGFLNQIQPKIREIITQRQLGRDEFTEVMSEQLSQYLVVPEQHQALVFEGLEPNGIAQDILESRLPAVYDIIFRDFPEDGVERFSTEFIYQMKRIAGEVFSEISECLHGGINDLQIIFRAWVNEPIVRIMGEGSLALIDSFITGMLWEKLKALVLQHQHEKENNQIHEEQKQNEGSESQSGHMDIERPTQNREEQELDLLEDIENGLEKDQTRFDRYNIQLSEEYKKGDFIKK